MTIKDLNQDENRRQEINDVINQALDDPAFRAKLARSFWDFIEKQRPQNRTMSLWPQCLDTNIVKDIQAEPIPDHTALMTVDVFKRGVEGNSYTDDDGAGWYATHDKMYKGFPAQPSKIAAGKKPPAWATHVVWFDR